MSYSVIVVLGNLMNAQGRLNSESLSRMKLAVDLLLQKEAPYLITCGWAYRSDSKVPIAKAMKTYAVDSLGVAPELIFTEETSRDTVGDAVFTKRNIISKKHWKDILVVTSDYHVHRTTVIFNFVFGEEYNIHVIGASSEYPSEYYSDSESKSLKAFYKTFDSIDVGDDESIYECIRMKHPFYNGEVHTKLPKE